MMMKPFIYVMMGIKSDVKSKMDRSGINGTLGLGLSAESLMVLFMPAVPGLEMERYSGLG